MPELWYFYQVYTLKAFVGEKYIYGWLKMSF